MSLNTTRRRILGGVGAGIGGGVIANQLLSHNERMAEKSTIDINLFVGQAHIDDFPASTDDNTTPYFTAERVAEHIEYAYTNLIESMGEEMRVDVSVIKTPIPTETLTYDIAGTLLSSWEEYVYENISPENRAADSNLLITLRNGEGNKSFTGNAHAPCGVCDGGNHTAGVLYQMRQQPYVHGMEPGEIHTTTYANTSNAQMMIAVHEVGHTIGLRHSDGEILTAGNKHPHLTLMASTDDLSEPGKYAIRTLEFSETITRSDLRLSEDNGLGGRTETPSLLDALTRVVNLRL